MSFQKITSFSVDHTKISKGLYVSRIDGDIVTYDMRMVKPNTAPFLENAGLHAFEHLFATYVRNSSFTGDIVYVGPMGCRTGFYFLVQRMTHQQVIRLLKETMLFISHFEGELPGNSEAECGNYLDHDVAQAKHYAQSYLDVIANWTPEMMDYRFQK